MAEKKCSRTKVLAGGVRVRVAKPGETEEQMDKWRQKILKGGHPSIVFRYQETMDNYFASLKAHMSYQRKVDRVMGMYQSGELVRKPKSSSLSN